MTTVAIPPRADNHKSRRPASGANIAGRAVYSGQDRLGSYRLAFGRWLAVDRLGRLIGEYDSERAAVDAILMAGACR